RFPALAAWQLYTDLSRRFEPMWAPNSNYSTSAPSSAGITGYVDDQYALMLHKLPVDLATYDHPALRFRVRIDTELGADYLLWGMANAPFGTPGPSETTVLGGMSGFSGSQFVEQIVDLEAYAGRSDVYLWLAFDASSSGSSAQGYDGVWVDDFEVFDLDPGASGKTIVITADHTDAYQYMDGTSMASPHVAGIAGLLISEHPALSVAEVKSAIMTSADPKPQLSGKCQSGARVNAHAVLAATNKSPVASADSYTTRENLALTVSAPGVLANDSDADGDTMTAHKVSGPAHGTVTLTANGSFTYTPATNWFGTDSFTYQASDGMSNSIPATVTVVVTDRIPVYRFYNFVNNTHFFTPSEDERQMILATWPDIFELDGVAYFVDPERNHDRLYRFYNKVSRSHFYTASSDEKDSIIRNLPHVFDYDGPTYPVNLTPVVGSTAVYRFFNLRNGSHFYTASEDEKASVEQNLGHTYQYEGVAFWVVQ
ncbi:hypothetical protein EG835_06570, partial [bacterium]|nr:hypothetical protein [bacterium]